VALRDLDGDGRLDLVTYGGDGAFVLWGAGDGTFPARTALGSGPYTGIFGDFDGDGRTDILGRGVVFLDRGRSFERVVNGVRWGYWPTVADIDGDGKDDVVTGEIAVHLSKGDGTFVEPTGWLGPAAMGGLVVDRTRPNAPMIISMSHNGTDQAEDLATLIVDHLTPNRAPVTSAAQAVVGNLVPPDHRMVPVSIAGVIDPDGDQVTIQVTGITQDEPVEGGQHEDRDHEAVLASDPAEREGGDHEEHDCPDGAIVDGQARVRWERAGRGNGRVYGIRFTATDGCGGTSEGRVSVCVPRRAGEACVDDGQRFNSLLCPPREVETDGAAAAIQAVTSLAVPAVAAERVRLRYGVAAEAEIRLEVFDVAGRRVAVLATGPRRAGSYEAQWGGPGRGGIYFARLSIGERRFVRRFVLLP